MRGLKSGIDSKIIETNEDSNKIKTIDADLFMNSIIKSLFNLSGNIEK